jgi:predicted nucleic acid-binding protein
MSGRFFLDTSIFVYEFDRNSPAKSRRATQLIHKAVTSRTGIVSYQVVQEFFNVALKHFAHPMTVADAEQYLSTVFRPLAAVHSSQGLYGEALRVKSRYRLGWYDSLIVAAAVQGRCSILYTEDLQDGLQIGDLKIENPFR